jgi:hypothetical protein
MSHSWIILLLFIVLFPKFMFGLFAVIAAFVFGITI